MQICTHIPHELVEVQWKYSVVTAAHKNNREDQRDMMDVRRGSARDATARVIPFICIEQAFHLVPPDSLWQSFAFVCHAMRGVTWKPPALSHARLVFYQQASSFVSDLTVGGIEHLPRTASPHTIGHLASSLGSATDTDWKEGGKKYTYCDWCENALAWPEENTNTWCVAKKKKSPGLGSSLGVPLVSSVSTKALVFQYTVIETVDSVGKRLCRAGPKPLRLC